jgi:hypothetical protein
MQPLASSRLLLAIHRENGISWSPADKLEANS